MVDFEKECIFNYLKQSMMDCVGINAIKTEEELATFYDWIIHSDLAKRLRIKQIKKLYLTYLLLVSAFNNNNTTIH